MSEPGIDLGWLESLVVELRDTPGPPLLCRLPWKRRVSRHYQMPNGIVIRVKHEVPEYVVAVEAAIDHALGPGEAAARRKDGA